MHHANVETVLNYTPSPFFQAMKQQYFQLHSIKIIMKIFGIQDMSQLNMILTRWLNPSVVYPQHLSICDLFITHAWQKVKLAIKIIFVPNFVILCVLVKREINMYDYCDPGQV